MRKKEVKRSGVRKIKRNEGERKGGRRNRGGERVGKGNERQRVEQNHDGRWRDEAWRKEEGKA